MRRADREALAELCEFIAENSTSIYVRGWFHGEVKSMLLSDLPASIALTFAMSWIRDMRKPPLGPPPEAEIAVAP